MHPEIPPGLLDLQRHVERIGQIARAVANATPPPSQGTDSTGCVKVTIGADGLPTQIRILDRWRLLREPDQLAAAVTEANNDAVQRAVAAWTADLGQNRQQHRVERPDSEDAERLPQGQVAEATELAERVLVTLQQVRRSPATEPTEYTGTDDGAHVSVQLGSGGLTGCTIDSRWAARYEGAAITAAVSAALVRATAERAAATTQPGADLDGVLGDALATLSALTRQPTPESED